MESIHVGRLIGVLYRQSLNYMHHALKDMGITPLECIFLVALFENEGANQEQLSALLVIDKAATAKAMKSLEEKGLVTREQCPNDKRAKRIHTTAQARKIRKPIDAMLRHWVDYLAQGMEGDGIDSALQSLNAMVDRAVNADHQALVKASRRGRE